ncbi:non-ribosomal peptide synthetase [Actinomadura oligospora]|uniref:non-ribosomal peptide synthetase n=1 Tax=Actinomadura oligospora TaxID=111804 RepID=UPI00047ACF1C|nr:non-ribosomal peptide synthetase [Actinomadura oligospora]
MNGGRPGLVARIRERKASVGGTRMGTPSLSPFHDGLAAAGTRPGDVVLLSGLRGDDILLAAMASWMLDAVPMPVAADVALPPGLGDACRISAGPTVIPGRGSGRVEGLERTAVLHLSSGSTDRPKIAKRGVESLLREAEGYAAGLPLVPGERVAVPVPLVHSLGWGVAMSALLNGCDVDAAAFAGAAAAAREIDSGAVSVVALTPPLARLLAGTRRTGRPRLRAALVGAGQVGDDLDEAFRKRFGPPLLRGYGSTETGATFLGETGMGRPMAGVEVVEPRPGARGELVLSLAAPAEGYLGSEGPVKEWRTGDMVRHDPDGTVHFVERLRGPLRLNGRFVDAGAVDRALRDVPGVKDVVLLVEPRPGLPEFEDFYALVETDDTSDEPLPTPFGGTPAPHVVKCRRLPRNTIGKPDRDAMLELVRGRPHLSATCDLLVAVLVARTLADRGGGGPSAERLASDPELRRTDFARLGLGSLDWLSLAVRLENETGVEVPEQALLQPESRCVEGWSQVLAERA